MRANAAIALAGLLLTPAVARAGNEDDFFPGNRAAMTAGAVTAVVADGSALYFNPAGLAATPGSRLDASASGYGLRLHSAPGFLRTAGGARQDASVNEVLAIPTQVAYARRLAEGIVLGLGYFVPRTGDALLRARITETNAATSTVSLDVRETTTSSLLAAGLGFRVSSRLRLGFGLFAAYDSTVFSSAIFGAVSRGATPDTVIQYSSLLTRSRGSAQLRAGLQLDLGGGFTLGLAARSPRLQLFRGGEQSINVAGVVSVEGSNRLTATTGDNKDTGAQVGLLEAGRYHAALSYQQGRTLVSAEVDLQPGLRSQRTEVDRRLAVNARVGALHALDDKLALGLGVFTDRATTAAAYYANYQGATLGIELHDLFKLAKGERAQTLTLTNVFALRYAYGVGPTQASLVRADPALSISAATSTQTTHEIGLHVGSSLQF